MEIVSKPDMRSAEEARAYVTKLRTILRYLGTCDGDMEKGNLRADVNVSVRRPGDQLGTRCEIKNVNSIRFIGQAIEYEARRQIDILEDGGTIDQETRLFDPGKGETRSMRSKEEAHDYRYFPDPDLLPLELDAGLRRRARRAACRSCRTTRRRASCADYGLSPYDAGVLVAERESGRLLRGRGQGPRRQAGRQLGDQRAVRPPQQGGPGRSTTSPVSAAQLGGLVDLIETGAISGKIAKDLFEIVWTEGGDPRAIVETRGLKQVTDTGAIEKAVDEIIAANPDKVEQAKAKPHDARLVRRPGDEGHRRQGQPAGRQRDPEGEARGLGLDARLVLADKQTICASIPGSAVDP